MDMLSTILEVEHFEKSDTVVVEFKGKVSMTKEEYEASKKKIDILKGFVETLFFDNDIRHYNK